MTRPGLRCWYLSSLPDLPGRSTPMRVSSAAPGYLNPGTREGPRTENAQAGVNPVHSEDDASVARVGPGQTPGKRGVNAGLSGAEAPGRALSGRSALGLRRLPGFGPGTRVSSRGLAPFSLFLAVGGCGRWRLDLGLTREWSCEREPRERQAVRARTDRSLDVHQSPPPQRYCQAIPIRSKLFPVRADTPLLA